jgi:hypothetical protein
MCQPNTNNPVLRSTSTKTLICQSRLCCMLKGVNFAPCSGDARLLYGVRLKYEPFLMALPNFASDEDLQVCTNLTHTTHPHAMHQQSLGLAIDTCVVLSGSCNRNSFRKNATKQLQTVEHKRFAGISIPPNICQWPLIGTCMASSRLSKMV